MTTSTGCPPAEEFRRLVEGTADPATAPALRHHAAACPGCLGVLRAFQGGDLFIERYSMPLAESTADGDRLLRNDRERPTSDRKKGEITATLATVTLPRVGPYQLLDTVGKGGMGTVYLARDIRLNRPVALKFLPSERLNDPDAVARFRREAHALARVSHPGIVQVYDCGEEAGQHYLALEFVEGRSLAAVLNEEGRVSTPLAAKWTREAALALQHAHERGLVHRDVKPSNLLLASGGHIKVLDLGLAKFLQDQLGDSARTREGVGLGTPDYAAPEQFRDARLVDPRADVYSLGCTCYQLLAGRVPFPGSSLSEKIDAHAEREPVPLERLREDVPGELAAIVRRMMAKLPANRFQTAQEVADALEPHCGIGPGLVPGQTNEHTTAVPARTTKQPLQSPPTRRELRWGALVGNLSPRPVLPVIAALAILALVLLLWRPWTGLSVVSSGPPIKVGVLHSLSGTLAESSNSVADATQLAIEEINQRGGLLGRRVEAVVRDGQDDWPLFGREAERLLTEDRVCAIFGCWTSASRKEVVPVVEKHDHLLLYPVLQEGLEQSPNVLYCSGVPNQQILPAVRYVYGFLGKRKFFLVGSDYVYPRVANGIIRDELLNLRGQVVGEAYILLGSGDVTEVVRNIKEANPDVILNTINGDSNRPFFRALRAAGVTPAKTPTVSFSIAEPELRSLGFRDMTGDYAAWNYFQSLERPENAEFVRRFRARFGAQRVTSDPMESAYTSVHLWAQAVAAAGTDEVKAVRQALRRQNFEAPGGPVRVEPETQHLYKTFRLGQVMDDGQFEVIHSSEKPIRPEPFPKSRTRADWESYLKDLRAGWGGQWAKPK